MGRGRVAQVRVFRMEAAVAIWMMMMMRMCGKQKREEATAALHRTRWSRRSHILHGSSSPPGCACFNHHGDEGGGGGGHHLLIPLHHQKRKEAALHRMRRGESGLAPGRGEEVTRVEVPTTWLWLRPELAGRWSPVGDGGDGGVLLLLLKRSWRVIGCLSRPAL